MSSSTGNYDFRQEQRSGQRNDTRTRISNSYRGGGGYGTSCPVSARLVTVVIRWCTFKNYIAFFITHLLNIQRFQTVTIREYHNVRGEQFNDMMFRYFKVYIRNDIQDFPRFNFRMFSISVFTKEIIGRLTNLFIIKWYLRWITILTKSFPSYIKKDSNHIKFENFSRNKKSKRAWYFQNFYRSFVLFNIQGFLACFQFQIFLFNFF